MVACWPLIQRGPSRQRALGTHLVNFALKVGIILVVDHLGEPDLLSGCLAGRQGHRRKEEEGERSKEVNKEGREKLTSLVGGGAGGSRSQVEV